MDPTLLTDYAGKDVSGWYVSEKIDGWRAVWDGERFWKRSGEPYDAPAWFLAGMPSAPLDGELYHPDGLRATQSRLQESGGAWDGIRFAVFDAPIPGAFAERLAAIQSLQLSRHVQLVEHRLLANSDEFRRFAADIISAGGEGAVARDPDAPYIQGRTDRVVRLKSVA